MISKLNVVLTPSSLLSHSTNFINLLESNDYYPLKALLTREIKKFATVVDHIVANVNTSRIVPGDTSNNDISSDNFNVVFTEGI